MMMLHTARLASRHRRALVAAAVTLPLLVLLVGAVSGATEGPRGPAWARHLSAPSVRDVHDVADTMGQAAAGYRPFSSYVDVSSLSFGVVVDLGSSGSRAHVFYWREGDGSAPELSVRPAPDHPCLCEGEDCAAQEQLCASIEAEAPDLQPFWVKKVTPGVSAYAPGGTEAGTDQSAGGSIAPLLSFAESLIPRDKHQSTPVLLFATAGLRILPEDQVDAILDSVRGAVLERGRFRFEPEWCRVISGTDEALFGWVSIQEAALLLTDGNGVEGNAAATVGVVDQGGASVEVSFAPSDSSWSADATIAHYRRHALMAGTTYSVYVHSYLGYGLNEARKLYIKALIDAAAAAAPAPPSNATAPEEQSIELEDPCYPLGALYTYEGPTARFVVSGSGKHIECRTLISQYLFPHDRCTHPSCSFGNVYQPPIEKGMTFFALDKVATVARFLEVPLKGSALSVLGDRSDEYCALSASELQEVYAIADEDTAKKLYKTCFEAQFCFTQLTDGYGFAETSKQVRFTKEYKGMDMSWALGAMIEMKENDYVFVSSSSWGSSTLSSFHLWLLVLSAGGVIVLGALLFTVAFLLHRRFRRRRLRQLEMNVPAEDPDDMAL